MSMGATSSQKIATYYAGMHMVLCNAPIDFIAFVQVKEKQVNNYPIMALPQVGVGGAGIEQFGVGHGVSQVYIDKPDLFGGLKREGGVQGWLSFFFGYPDQIPSPYLQGLLGAFTPAYRGVVSVILNRVFLGTSYYLQTWRFFATRVTVLAKGEPQWEAQYSCPTLPLDMTYAFIYLGTETQPENFGILSGQVYVGYYVLKGTSIWVVLSDSDLDKPETYRPITLSPTGGLINAVHVIRECLTDEEWGLGEPVANIDNPSFLLAAQTCYAEGLGFSWLWDKTTTIEDFITDVARHINAVVYKDRKVNKWKITLIRKVENLSALPVVTPDHVQKINKLSRKQFHDLVSQYLLKYESNLTYKDASIRVADPSLAARQGKEVLKTVTFSGIATPEVAQIIAMRELHILSTSVYTGAIVGDRTLATLNPGDAFVLKKFGVLESDLVLRVVSIDIGTALKEPVTVEFTEDAFEATKGILAIKPVTRWIPEDNAPSPVEFRRVFETPYYIQALEKGDTAAQAIPETSTFLRVSAVSPSGLSISSDLWNTTSSTYRYAGIIDFQFSGVLAAGIDRIETGITYASAIDIETTSVGSILYLEDELIQIVALYPITQTMTVKRGILDTIPVSHPLGSRFIQLRSINSYDPVEYAVGETIKAKLLTETPIGKLPIVFAPEDILELTGRMHRPYPPGDFRLNGENWATSAGSTGSVVFSWVSRNRFQQTTSDILDYYSGSVTTEPSVTYELTLRLDSDGTELYSYSGGDLSRTVSYLDLPPTLSTPVSLRAELKSINAFGSSFQTISHVFTFNPPELIFLDEFGNQFTDADGVTLLGI